VVTGTIITMIGVVLMRVGVNWAGGGAGSADFGAAGYLVIAALVLGVILLVIKFASGFVQNMAVLIGVKRGLRADSLPQCVLGGAGRCLQPQA
jgi:uric acid transporter